MEINNVTINASANADNADYKNLYLTAMNELKEISNVAIASQRKLEEMFLDQTDPARILES